MIENRLPWPASPAAPPDDAAAAIRREYESWATAPEPEEDTLDGELARSIVMMTIAAFVAATALSALYDPRGTAAIVADFFRWWLL